MRAYSASRDAAKFAINLLSERLAGSFSTSSLWWAKRRPRFRRRVRWLSLVAFVALAALFARGTFMQALGRTFVAVDYHAVWAQEEDRALLSQSLPGGRVIDWIKRTVPDNAKLLVYRQAEFAYYVDQSWVYDFDPKIMDLYEIPQTKEAVHSYLQDQGIGYVYVPNYMPATLYNTAVSRVIGDPAYAQELYHHSGSRVYGLHTEPAPKACIMQGLGRTWVQGIIGGRSTFESGGLGIFGPEADVAAPKTFALLEDKGSVLTGREFIPFGAKVNGDGSFFLSWPDNILDRIGLVSGYGPLHLAPRVRVDRDHVDALNMSFGITGEGMLEIWLYEYDDIGAVSSRRLWDAVLDASRGRQEVDVQASLLDSTNSYRLLIVNGGSAGGYARVSGIRLCGHSTGEGQNAPRSAISDRAALYPAQNRLADVNEWQLYLGTNCYRLSWFCRTLKAGLPSRELLIQESGAGELIANLPINTGYTLTNAPLSTSLKSLWQCDLGRRKWFTERSPARYGFFEHYFMRFQQSQQPAGNGRGDRLAQLRHTIELAPNTVVEAAANWVDEQGNAACYYLGQQPVGARQSVMEWEFPLAEDAQELTFAFTATHTLIEYVNARIGEIQLRVGEAGSGYIPPRKRGAPAG